MNPLSAPTKIGPDTTALPLRVSQQQADERFTRDFPIARKAWGELMYMMPDDSDTMLIEPQYVYSYAEVYSSEEGENVSRRKLAAYSAVDPTLAPADVGERPSASEEAQ